MGEDEESYHVKKKNEKEEGRNEKKEEAIRLKKKGLSVSAISEEFGVPKSTVGTWVGSVQKSVSFF